MRRMRLHAHWQRSAALGASAGAFDAFTLRGRPWHRLLRCAELLHVGLEARRGAGCEGCCRRMKVAQHGLCVKLAVPRMKRADCWLAATDFNAHEYKNGSVSLRRRGAQ